METPKLVFGNTKTSCFAVVEDKNPRHPLSDKSSFKEESPPSIDVRNDLSIYLTNLHIVGNRSRIVSEKNLSMNNDDVEESSKLVVLRGKKGKTREKSYKDALVNT